MSGVCSCGVQPPTSATAPYQEFGTADVVWHHAGDLEEHEAVEIERGYRLEAIAVALAADIAELREDGGLPDHVHTRITVLPQQRLLEIRVEGLSAEIDPDRTTSREVMNTLFELASDHNIITLDTVSPPLFTQRIVLVDPYGQPFAAKVGAGMGEPEPFTPRS